LEKARQAVDLHQLLGRTFASEEALGADERRLVYVEYAEDIVDYLVDYVDANGDLIEDVIYDANARRVPYSVAADGEAPAPTDQQLPLELAATS
jgi:hypothetical protein